MDSPSSNLLDSFFQLLLHHHFLTLFHIQPLRVCIIRIVQAAVETILINKTDPATIHCRSASDGAWPFLRPWDLSHKALS